MKWLPSTACAGHNRMALSAGLRIGLPGVAQFKDYTTGQLKHCPLRNRTTPALTGCTTGQLQRYLVTQRNSPVAQPDGTFRGVAHWAARSGTIQVLSSYTTGQLKHCPVAQPDNSSANRLHNRTTPALPGYATGQSRCATGWHFLRGCALGCPEWHNSSIVWLHNRTTKALPGCTTGQLQR